MEKGKVAQWGNGQSGLGLFARNFLSNPAMLGWFIPSSRFLIERLLKQINWDQAKLIVEYGPGVGTITAPLLQRLRPDAQLLVLETNADFIQYLHKSFADPRLHIVHESAAEVDRVLAQYHLGPADYVISGVPFSLVPAYVREAIIQKTRAILRPEGAFLVYQFAGSALPSLKRVFRVVHQQFEFRNLLPARLFFCTA